MRSLRFAGSRVWIGRVPGGWAPDRSAVNRIEMAGSYVLPGEETR